MLVFFEQILCQNNFDFDRNNFVENDEDDIVDIMTMMMMMTQSSVLCVTKSTTAATGGMQLLQRRYVRVLLCFQHFGKYKRAPTHLTSECSNEMQMQL